MMSCYRYISSYPKTTIFKITSLQKCAKNVKKINQKSTTQEISSKSSYDPFTSCHNQLKYQDQDIKSITTKFFTLFVFALESFLEEKKKKIILIPIHSTQFLYCHKILN